MAWPSIEFSSPLGAAGWLTLAAVPVGLIALYFLKLRRRPISVPSTLLWRRSLEDLHVNSLFQRLRRNLLLFLQLLAVGLAMLALTGPRIKGTAVEGKRVILMIDDSASMSATDLPPSRLERAKDEAKKVVQSMEAGDLAMVVAFSNSARVVSNYTGDQELLAHRIDGIRSSQSSTSLREALQVAAGLANPSKQIGEGVVASTVVTPKLLIYTDGGFGDVEGFSLGNLEPEIVVIGPPPPPFSLPDGAAEHTKNPSDNVAILAFEANRNDENPDVHQLFGRVRNYRAETVATEARLIRHDPDQPGGPGILADVIALEIPPQSDQSFKFDVPDAGLEEFEVRLAVDDALAMDDRAFAIVGAVRKARVLAATVGNRYLLDALQTPTAVERAEITIASPEEIREGGLAQDVRDGRFDLVIYDQIRPARSPAANTLYLGAFPPGPLYDEFKDVSQPVILDWDVAHPLLRYVRDLSLVLVARARIVEPPAGATRLIESNQGALAFVTPREGYLDAVVTFPLMDGSTPNTTWFRYISFPLFILNSIQTLGNVRDSSGSAAPAPGKPLVLREESAGREITVVSADGRRTDRVPRSPEGTFIYDDADAAGLYHARWEPDGRRSIAVNLFDARESDVAPRGLVPEGTPPSLAESYKIKIGYNAISGRSGTAVVPKDWWKFPALLALLVLLIEWYVYNRRVYL